MISLLHEQVTVVSLDVFCPLPVTQEEAGQERGLEPGTRQAYILGLILGWATETLSVYILIYKMGVTTTVPALREAGRIK